MEKIFEKIVPIIKFEEMRLIPLSFYWQGKDYQIDKINFVYWERVGQTKIYYFSVEVGGLAYELIFNSETFNWKLGRIDND